jgi:hypothetical protein
MPLNTGQQYALYVLLAQHPHSPPNDGKSALRLAVESAVPGSPTPQDYQTALQNAAAAMDPNIDTSAIGPFTLDDAQSIRSALALPYSGAACPTKEAGIDIYNALKNAMT